MQHASMNPTIFLCAYMLGSLMLLAQDLHADMTIQTRADIAM